MKIGFELRKTSKKSQARFGVLRTSHGVIETPFFLPVATKAAVRGLEISELKDFGYQAILSNTYHNLLQPGSKVINKFGGLHKFMNCDLPILTDSGGFQIFSLEHLTKLTDKGVHFRSPIDGAKHYLTPEKAIDIQAALGSDIMMVLDNFPGYPATRQKAKAAVELTLKWAKKCLERKIKIEARGTRHGARGQMLFAIVQGSTFKDLRLQSARDLVKLPFSGFAIGGLAVGEPADKMYKVLDYVVPELPADKAHYLMGVGYPENIVQAVKRGIDMFDCVIPTREARHGRLFYWNRKTEDGSRMSGKNFYKTINIRSAKFKADKSPISPGSPYSKAYLHHLFKTNEMLGMRLATQCNLAFYSSLLSVIRKDIRSSLI